MKYIKNKLIIEFYLKLILRFVNQIITYFIYPIIYLLRHKSYKYVNQRFYKNKETHLYEMYDGYNKSDLYKNVWFWVWTFLCGIEENRVGNGWFKKDLKEKWFDEFSDNEFQTPIPHNFKQRLQMAYLSYLWAGLRNASWNSGEWFFSEGGHNEETYKILKENTPEIIGKYTFNYIKFKDADGTDRNMDGPYIKYSFDCIDNNQPLWTATYEGEKIAEFITYKGKKRFKRTKVKIYKLNFIKRFFIIGRLSGWNYYDGDMIFHFKNIFIKFDEVSLSDYNKYIELINKK